MKVYSNLDLGGINKVVNSDVASGSTDLVRLNEYGQSVENITNIENTTSINNAELTKKMKSLVHDLDFPDIDYSYTGVYRNWNHITSYNNKIVAITNDGDVLCSTDNGINWIEDKMIVKKWTGSFSIPFANFGGYGEIPITINELGSTISKIEVLNVNLSNSWVGDIVLKLKSPDGTTIILSSGIGGGSDFYTNTSFSDEASVSIMNAPTPFTGTWRPVESLSAFTGKDMSGDWKLMIIDTAYDGGAEYAAANTVTSFDLNIHYTLNVDSYVDSSLYNSISNNGDIFVAVGNSGNTMYSEDGCLSWTDGIVSIENNILDFSDMIYGNNIFVATLSQNITGTTNGSIATSIDGINWLIQSSDTYNISNGFNNITYNNGLFVAVSITGYVITSTDGINWTVPINSLFIGEKKITSGNGKILVTPLSGNTIYTSINSGLTFDEITINYIFSSPSLSFGDDRYLIVSKYATSGEYILESIDGIVFTLLENTLDIIYNNVTYNGLGFHVISDNVSGFIPNRVSNKIISIDNDIETLYEMMNDHKVEYTTTKNITGVYSGNTITFAGGWSPLLITGITNVYFAPSLPYGYDSIYFFNNMFGWYSTNNSQVYKTTDGGYNWELVFTSTHGVIWCFDFNDANNGWAGGSNGYIYKITDGIWSEIQPNPSFTQSITHITSTDNNSVWASTTSSFIWRSFDGGSTWDKIAVAGNESASICMVNRGTGFLGIGNLLKTVDSGTTWYVSKSISSARYYDIQFIDDNIGYALCGNISTVIKTIDGGITWNIVLANANIRLYSLIVSGNDVWTVGNMGVILYSSNAGTTWKTQKYIGYSALRKMYASGSTLMLYGSYDATFMETNVLYTTNKGISPLDSFDINTVPYLGNDQINDPTIGNRLLVKDQTSKLQNGIYTITENTTNGNYIVGETEKIVLTRSTKLNNYEDSSIVYVKNGVLFPNCGFIQTTKEPITVGVSSMDYKQMSSPDYIDKITSLQNQIYTLSSGLTNEVFNDVIIISGSTNTGITLTKYYASVEVVSTDGTIPVVTKQYNSNGSSITIDFGTTFYGKVIIR